MSNHSDSASLLDVDKLFLWFTTIYGSQKMLTSWDNVPAVERAAVWSRALGKYPPKCVYAAMNELAENGTGWPPTLPEFVALVKAKLPVAAHMKALPVPDRTADEIAAGAVQMATIRDAVAPKKDNAQWAYKVIERYKAGDSVVAHASYKIAVEALRNLGREVLA